MDSMMSIDDLRVVLAVAAQGGFVAAARRTGVPPSTVSRAVARLEEALGARFFQRTSRTVRLTEEGARLVARAAPLLDELDEIVDDVAERSTEPAGRLRVTAPTVSGSGRIGAALVSFAAAHPRVSVELSLSNAVVDLVDEGFDLAFRGGPVEGTDLIARRVWSVPYAIAASRTFVRRALGGRTAIDRDALESLPAILARPGAAWRFRRAAGSIVDVRPKARFCATDLRVEIDAARAGLGVVRAPRDLVDEAGLVVLKPSADLGQPESRAMFAVYPSRRLVPKRVRLAIDWVARAFASPQDSRRSRRRPATSAAP
jgi:DNA-binding transcriptional LysR family regulator